MASFVSSKRWNPLAQDSIFNMNKIAYPNLDLHSSSTMWPYSPDRLLDTAMQWLGISTDKALAKKLGFTPHVIAGLRSRHIPIAAWMLKWIAECTGIGLEEVRHILGDRRAKVRPSCLLAHREKP
jgi:hypothetical protein